MTAHVRMYAHCCLAAASAVQCVYSNTGSTLPELSKETQQA
jgi:hypothetical protein